MPLLLVRDIERFVVKKLHSNTAAQGVSAEEAHRRLLRSVLIGNKAGVQQNFIEYLRSIPQGAPVEFPRSAGLPRQAAL